MYKIRKVDHHLTDINDKAWDLAQTADVALKNWGDYECEPHTVARVVYSDYGLHVKLTTDEKVVYATHRVQNEQVCEDSCMEFFFRANENDPRYINMEFNPFGTMYMSVRTSRFDPYYPAEDKHFFEVQSAVEPNEWTIMFSIPFDFLDRELGGHTKKMFGNFFKCCGANEHYYTYYPISTPEPDFHQPAQFGALELE